jgi:hypothetical protein
MKAANYTDEMVTTATNMYEAGGNDALEEIATLLGRTVRSVRSKLVREGVYVAAVKPEAKPKDEGPTKKELLIELDALGAFSTVGLDGATKPAIQALIDFVNSEVQEAGETDAE